MGRHRVELLRTFIVESDDKSEVEAIVRKYISMEKDNENFQIKATVTELKEGEVHNSRIQELCNKLLRYDAVLSEGSIIPKTRQIYHESIKETLDEITNHFEKLMQGA